MWKEAQELGGSVEIKLVSVGQNCVESYCYWNTVDIAKASQVSVGQNCVERSEHLRRLLFDKRSFRRTELCGKFFTARSADARKIVSVGQNCVESDFEDCAHEVVEEFP